MREQSKSIAQVIVHTIKSGGKPVDKKGRFIKGNHYSPITEFKTGQVSPRKGVSKPGWTNKTSFKTGQKPWNTNKKIPEISGANHPSWKGDKVGYTALHSWINRTYGKPNVCQKCQIVSAKRFHWANKSGKYLRNIEDWIRLCVSCHKNYDLGNISL